MMMNFKKNQNNAVCSMDCKNCPNGASQPNPMDDPMFEKSIAMLHNWVMLEAMDYAQASPSLSQAQRLKKLSQEGGCTLDAMCEVMNEIKKDELDHVTIKNEVLRKYFPKSYTPKQMQDTIIRLLEKWQRSKQRDMER